jgi:hypothetical protein
MHEGQVSAILIVEETQIEVIVILVASRAIRNRNEGGGNQGECRI